MRNIILTKHNAYAAQAASLVAYAKTNQAFADFLAHAISEMTWTATVEAPHLSLIHI